MKLKWYCGMNADCGDFGTEPAECDGEGVYELQSYQEEDWAEGLTPCIECHKCEQILEDPSHYSVHNEFLRGHKGENEFSVELQPWEPPLPEDYFNVGDHVLFEGGVWEVTRACVDEFDDRDQKLSVRWVAGPRMSENMLYATGISAADVRILTEMEVLAYSSK